MLLKRTALTHNANRNKQFNTQLIPYAGPLVVYETVA